MAQALGTLSAPGALFLRTGGSCEKRCSWDLHWSNTIIWAVSLLSFVFWRPWIGRFRWSVVQM